MVPPCHGRELQHKHLEFYVVYLALDVEKRRSANIPVGTSGARFFVSSNVG